MVVDAHSHFVPPELVSLIANGRGPRGVSLERPASGDPVIVHETGLRYALPPAFSDVGAKIDAMGRHGIDTSVVSIAPPLFMYALSPNETTRHAMLVNDAAASYAAAGRGCIRAMATLPMNDPEAAARELRRAVVELGLVGAEIGTSVGAKQLDSPDLDPVYAAAAELAVPLMLHPYVSMTAQAEPDLAGYHLSNVVGNPIETSIAAARMIVGGVFDRHPALRVLLVHGGGFLPYQLGRLQHAYAARSDTSAVAEREPSHYLRNLLFDTVVFDVPNLTFLINRVGADRVLFGTDLPFDMADTSGLELKGFLAPEVTRKVLGENAARIFSFPNGCGGPEV